MSGCECEVVDPQEGKTLIILLSINALMFLIEISFGILSESTALVADSLDMLADAAVYSIALYAVGGSRRIKIRAALLSGIFQVTLGITVFIDVIRRLISGSDPDSFSMISVGLIALVANIICLAIVSKYKAGEVHMRASWIFSKNDVIANVGVVLGGICVQVLNWRFPDLIIGAIISVIVVRGGFQIIKDARDEKEAYSEEHANRLEE